MKPAILCWFWVTLVAALGAQRESFDSAWKFARFGDMPDGSQLPEAAASAPDFDDSQWRGLKLPHDRGIEGPAEGTTIVHSLLDEDGKTVASGASKSGSACLQVKSPTLWNTENPYHYTLRTTLVRDNEELGALGSAFHTRDFSPIFRREERTVRDYNLSWHLRSRAFLREIETLPGGLDVNHAQFLETDLTGTLRHEWKSRCRQGHTRTRAPEAF